MNIALGTQSEIYRPEGERHYNVVSDEFYETRYLVHLNTKLGKRISQCQSWAGFVAQAAVESN